METKISIENIPKEVRLVALTLEAAGFETYLVGGSVRDFLLGKQPKDYDLTTSATPEQIISLFPKTFYENTFGTVGVVTCGEEVGVLCTPGMIKIVEVTPFRVEGAYSDKRHPDVVSFSTDIKDDLKRRDFTINALAYRVQTGELLDLFKGRDDLDSKIIRAVGNPELRFEEDALRMLRAVRFSAQLGFHVEQGTSDAIKKLSQNLEHVSKERIRDEFIKIVESDTPMNALILTKNLGMLSYILPELEKGIAVRQNQAHSFDVWEHNLRTLQHAADKKWPLHVRLSALLHDISKPETRRFSREKGDYTFYGHEVVGSRVSHEILTRLKFSREMIDKVSLFVRWHMFFSDTEQITLSAVRRLIANVGKENVWDLMDLRVCDRIGTGRPKEDPYRLRLYKSMVEEAMTDPISLKMLKIDGVRIMAVTELAPSPKVGLILHSLFGEVLEDPKKNNEEYLESRAKELVSCEIETLKEFAEKGKFSIEEKNKTAVKQIRRKFHVK
jgi:poly(A) polymerase/tRNA nucleotidyltransferase (CCA-adding enzyme)